MDHGGDNRRDAGERRGKGVRTRWSQEARMLCRANIPLFLFPPPLAVRRGLPRVWPGGAGVRRRAAGPDPAPGGRRRGSRRGARAARARARRSPPRPPTPPRRSTPSLPFSSRTRSRTTWRTRCEGRGGGVAGRERACGGRALRRAHRLPSLHPVPGARPALPRVWSAVHGAGHRPPQRGRVRRGREGRAGCRRRSSASIHFVPRGPCGAAPCFRALTSPRESAGTHAPSQRGFWRLPAFRTPHSPRHGGRRVHPSPPAPPGRPLRRQGKAGQPGPV